MKDLKDKTKQTEADKTSPNYTEASDDRKEAQIKHSLTHKQ